MEAPLDDYSSLRSKYPELFLNPSEAGVQILQFESEIEDAQQQARTRLADKKLPLEWARVGVVFQDEYLLIVRDPVRFPDGSLGTYVRLVSAPDQAVGVAILPIHEGRIVMVRHFRHATRTFHLEIPRGFGEIGSMPAEDARRELREEINVEAVDLVALGPMHPNTGISSERVELFFAQVMTRPTLKADKEAITSIHEYTLDDAERLILSGELSDSFSIAALYRAKLRNLV